MGIKVKVCPGQTFHVTFEEDKNDGHQEMKVQKMSDISIQKKIKTLVNKQFTYFYALGLPCDRIIFNHPHINYIIPVTEHDSTETKPIENDNEEQYIYCKYSVFSNQG